MRSELFTPRIEQALRWAARRHAGQTRKGSGVPYFEHVAAVALIVDRAGFDEDAVIAGVLHDVVEDTGATVEEVGARFGDAVALTVRYCSEVKHDSDGRKRPWIDRKRDHLAAMAGAPTAALAVILADKLHNLVCIELDLSEGQSVWTQFNAGRSQVLWYYRSAIDACSGEDPRLRALAESARAVLDRIERSGPPV
jgi:(p)ppGpp synthase/HD superfamily hydrolase